MTQKRFSEIVSLVPSRVSEIISNRRTIKPEVAAKLQEALDIPAKEWLDMQTNYRLAHKEASEEIEAAELLYKFDDWVSLKTLLARSNGIDMEGSIAKISFLKKFGIISEE